jgi:acyl dehydratase
VPHPSIGWFLAMRGGGVTIDELLGLFDVEPGTSTVLGEAELEFHAPLRVGSDYRTESTIAEVERKVGRSGPFDRIVLRVDVLDQGHAQRACTLWNTMIVPRPGSA